MPQSRLFFPIAKSTPVDKLLMDVNILLSLPTKDLKKLRAYQNQLQGYLTNSNQSGRTKRMINKALDETAAHLAVELAECLIQIPSATDLSAMTAMPAGADEDQQSRLSNMSKLVRQHSTLPIKTTDELNLNDAWQQLFKLINLKEKAQALAQLQHLASTDPLLQLIMTIHPIEYLKTMISYCIDAQAKGYKRLNSDILITPKTFELSIKDMATSLSASAPLYFSFGLPSHHAFSDAGSGFCLFNKTALLMKNAEAQRSNALKYVIIGTDVNRDNGLCNILNQSMSHLDICHVDIFDSRVYPGQDFTVINHEFRQKPKNHTAGINEWQHDKMHYYAVDLALEPRATASDIHPALVYALKQLEEQIQQAKSTKQQIMLLLPTGWDSHQDETAYCGKFVAGRLMPDSEAKKYRFNNQDLVYFYEQVLQLYKVNKESIAGVYWGLEGGYDRAMYTEQIPLLLTTLALQLKEEPIISPGLRC